MNISMDWLKIRFPAARLLSCLANERGQKKKKKKIWKTEKNEGSHMSAEGSESGAANSDFAHHVGSKCQRTFQRSARQEGYRCGWLLGG